ncbi:hypothetical protein P171DRAFT_111512 [Karstenula rhodostoma CBS 690.94]|uniref:Uncharacterized protein n=1 Tax=Karstenula rhodostoma CBS 690.94 TaxID=1392251 RepID=A0A9P4P9G7_9PLEO|nr:hypothetical protein P171DRAFT_111512 [Karstenula rhodostoma CBS 690.94]
MLCGQLKTIDGSVVRHSGATSLAFARHVPGYGLLEGRFGRQAGGRFGRRAAMLRSCRLAGCSTAGRLQRAIQAALSAEVRECWRAGVCEVGVHWQLGGTRWWSRLQAPFWRGKSNPAANQTVLSTTVRGSAHQHRMHASGQGINNGRQPWKRNESRTRDGRGTSTTPPARPQH